MTLLGKRYGAYHRISRMNGRVLEDESTITDKVAWEQIDAWARMRQQTIAERYLDTDQSGSKMSRPALDRMLADLDAGRIDGIVVAQVDRLSRADVGDALTVIKRIIGDDEANKRSLVILDLGIDPSTEFGEFGLTILLGLARMQWRRYKRQWATAQARATKRGIWIGPAPLGYVKNGARQLERDDPTWRNIHNAFEIAAAEGLHAAARYLREQFPDKRWRTADVRRVLSNRAYLGEHHNGGASHQPVTSIATFEAAQTEARGRATNGEYPLTGLAHCDRCGEPVVGAVQTVRGRRYRRMRCSANGCGSINADAFEAHVLEQVKARLGDRRFRALLEPVGREDAAQTLADAQAGLEQYLLGTAGLGLSAESIAIGASAHQQRVEDARERLREVAELSARRENIPAADELDDPRELVRAIRAGVVHLSLIPGRGPVGERVVIRFVGDDLDQPAGTPAA